MEATKQGDLEACAHLCHECQDMCLKTLGHCLSMGGMHVGREHITQMLDCIAMCGLAHECLHRESGTSSLICRACSEICRSCARGCEEVGRGDLKMRECARMCQRCAQECASVAY